MNSQNPDRTNFWDQNAAADALFGAEGGIAVWVRRPEIGARAAIRKGGADVAEVVMELAALLQTCNSLCETFSQRFGIKYDDFMGMIEVAGDAIGPHVEHVTRLKDNK